MKKLELHKFHNRLSYGNRVARGLWNSVCFFLVRPAIFGFMWPWRRFFLRLFGAKIHRRSFVHPSVWIWAPWNLELGAYSCLAPKCKVYNTGKISIGSQTTISQGAYLCPGSHDISDPRFPMICSEMIIEDNAWIATEAFVGGRNVRIGEGAVIAARAVVFETVEPWTVVAGNPAKFIKRRVIRES